MDANQFFRRLKAHPKWKLGGGLGIPLAMKLLEHRIYG
jgi:hypothetical protein